MRTEIIETETKQEAEALAPWAAELHEVEGGWMAFESMYDYMTWLRYGLRPQD